MFHEKVWKNAGKGICILYSDDCALFICISLALTGVSQLTMKNNANGNLIDKNGEPTNNIEEAVGSELVGQDFTEDYFFRGRVSSVNYNTYTEEQKENGEYTGVSSGSFNYANSNPELEKRIRKIWMSFWKLIPE